MFHPVSYQRSHILDMKLYRLCKIKTRVWLETKLKMLQKQPLEVFYIKSCSLKISQTSQENRPQPATSLKKILWHRCVPVNFAKILRTPFLQNTSGPLLLTACRFSIWEMIDNLLFTTFKATFQGSSFSKCTNIALKKLVHAKMFFS